MSAGIIVCACFISKDKRYFSVLLYLDSFTAKACCFPLMMLHESQAQHELSQAVVYWFPLISCTASIVFSLSFYLTGSLLLSTGQTKHVFLDVKLLIGCDLTQRADYAHNISL